MQTPTVLGGAYYVPLLTLETFFVVLAAVKRYEAWRENSPKLLKGGGLLFMLTRDSFLYFIG